MNKRQEQNAFSKYSSKELNNKDPNRRASGNETYTHSYMKDREPVKSFHSVHENKLLSTDNYRHFIGIFETKRKNRWRFYDLKRKNMKEKGSSRI